MGAVQAGASVARPQGAWTPEDQPASQFASPGVFGRDAKNRVVFHVPKTMKVVQLVSRAPAAPKGTDDATRFGDADAIQDHFAIVEVPVPKPDKGELLVKIESAVVHPADLNALAGRDEHGTTSLPHREPTAAQQANKSKDGLPCSLGIEGAGRVVASGSGLVTWRRKLGDRVAVASKFGGRMWAEYAVVPALTALSLPDDVSLDAGAASFINPLAALCFVDIAKAAGVKTILLTAAASALGRMVIRQARTEGINTIAIVRREGHAHELKAIGARAVVVAIPVPDGEPMTECKWAQELRASIDALSCHLAFDNIGGKFTGFLLEMMQNRSTLYVFGNVSNTDCCDISARELMVGEKKIVGFHLANHLADKNALSQNNLLKRVAKGLKTTLRTEVRQVFPLDQVSNAVAASVTNPSMGKIVLSPTVTAVVAGKDRQEVDPIPAIPAKE